MKYQIIHFILFLSFLFVSIDSNDCKASDRQSYKIYVDKEGIMRRSDTNGEVSFYGTNYTLPFAHAFRAMNDLGVDRKKAIDRDIYHLKRLGFNGFRLHLWDVEISDSLGNLLQNEHLDLLDYLISKLENEGIDIILTAQTNFGNGYPEKNIDTGGYSYDFDKCDIHENKIAQQIQENYLRQLVSHVNPYSGRSYADDNAIIAIEINNEPCHSGTPKEVTAYINKMVKALKKSGFDKPVLYNVSHNPDVTEAYYEANIEGTTYQWYPTGLVAGHLRKGNFLPYVQDYAIPWKDSMKNYDKMAKVVYEFDPGDVLYSYLYPAIARTFRKEGFQWITQFAYDPIDMARFNTEYQTHFLNLAYTPSKALSMLIAGEAARNIPRGTDYGSFPTDTIFGDFTVSYLNDLSTYNTPEKFYYSNSTTQHPRHAGSLENIAGVGSSPVIEYSGTGAYFLDQLKPGLWRLEVMPDVVIVDDPFEKPSLKKEIAKIFYNANPISIKLPQLGKSFYYRAINDNNDRNGKAEEGSFYAYPGVYLLSENKNMISDAIQSDRNGGLARFVAPEESAGNSVVVHTPPHYINPEGDLKLKAYIYGSDEPEEVIIYPDYVSFWNDRNTLIPMKKTGKYEYEAIVSKDQLGWGNSFGYNIVVSEKDNNYTWPDNVEGTPLDWDYLPGNSYSSLKLDPAEEIVLLAPEAHDSRIDVAMIPEAWNFRFMPELKAPVGSDSYRLIANPEKDGKVVVRRYVGDELKNAPFIEDKTTLVIRVEGEAGLEGATLGLVGKNGATYSAPLVRMYINPVRTKLHSEIPEPLYYRIPLNDLAQTPTHIIPAQYPSFLPREIEVEPLPFDISQIDFVELSIPVKKNKETDIAIQGIWLE